MISDSEKNRYDRHIKLAEVGIEGQEKLKKAKVLVIGSGGLGCPVLQYLSAAGIGAIGVMDADLVTLSNLQRQVLFTAKDIGKHKTTRAIKLLCQQNPNVKFLDFPFYLTVENALEILKDFDVIVDCTDNFPSRYLINDACVLLKKPFVYGALHKFEGQLSVFNHEGSPTYRCLYPDFPKQDEIPNCSEVGVLGVLPSLIGTMQATEVLKIILGIGEVSSGKLLTYNILSNKQTTISFSKSDVHIKNLSSYQLKCNYSSETEISVMQLKQWFFDKKEFSLIDVREYYERDDYKLDDTHFIPMGEVMSSLNEIDRNLPVVVYCESGSKSKSVVYMLKKQAYKEAYSLIGGVSQWRLDAR